MLEFTFERVYNFVKKDSNTGALLWNFQIVKDIFLQNSSGGCFSN